MDSQNTFRFISRILIAFGIMFINLFLFSVLAEFICKAVYHTSISHFLNTLDARTPSDAQLGALRMFQGIVSFGTFIVSSFVISLAFRQKPSEYLGLNSFPKPLYLVIIPVLLIVAMPFLSWLVEINGQLELPGFLSRVENALKSMELKNEQMYDLMLRMDNYQELFINILVMALIPAIGEEFFCRGVLLNIIYDHSGKFFRSVVIVALIFTLFHLQVYKFVPMMVLAIILGLFINWTRGIWASVLFHFLNNCMAIAGSFYYDRGYKNYLTDEHASIPFIMIVASFFITIALIVFVNKYSKEPQPLNHE